MTDGKGSAGVGHRLPILHQYKSIPLEEVSPWPSTGKGELMYLRTGVEVTACLTFSNVFSAGMKLIQFVSRFCWSTPLGRVSRDLVVG